MNWLIELINRSLLHALSLKGLRWDKRHKRHIFVPDKPGHPKEVKYTPLNKTKKEVRQVVWQPKTRATGLTKSFWHNRAVNLRFLRCAPGRWCLAIRPEYHVTQDGEKPLDSEKIGARITRKKARLFNYDYLGDIQFWRSYLSDTKPRIIMDYGNQALVILSDLMTMEIQWPGIPTEFGRNFKNTEFPEDLFSWHEAQLAGGALTLREDEGDDKESSDSEDEDEDDED